MYNVGYGGVLDYTYSSGKYYSISMPNEWNFAFDFEYFIYAMPFLYLAFFPLNYFYMLRQRKNYFAQMKQKTQ